MKYEFRTTFNLLTIVYPWALDTIVSLIILTSFYISFEMQIFDIAKKKKKKKIFLVCSQQSRQNYVNVSMID